MAADLSSWIRETFQHEPGDLALFERALTHGSQSTLNYERLEFLGDRILGLLVARWLFVLFPDEPEGKLSRRLNALVSGGTCAEIGRAIGVPTHLRLGKQARDDGANDSDNVLGDVVESLIAAVFLEGGLEAADRFVRSAWGDRVLQQQRAPLHPKSALQEWAAAHNRRPPVYEITNRAGPHHAPRFTITVSIKGAGEASAEGSSKQDAETAAARALLEKLQ